MQTRDDLSRYRLRLLVALLVVTPLGFGTKFYAGPGASWMRHHAGGVVYEIFWILLVLWVWPRLSPLRVASGVFVVTCALEILQLWHPAPLEWVRGAFLGRALIGSTFSAGDFPHYVAGSALGFVLARWLARSWVSRRDGTS